MRKITVDMVDDHQMILGGLKDMLQNMDNIMLGNAYTTGVELLKGLQKQQPDVLLLDIQMQDVNGDELCAIINKSYPMVRILVVTGFNTADYATLMLEKGAQGYLLKNTDEHKLKYAIETVYKGGKYIEPSIQDKINNNTYSGKSRKPSLSKREKAILQLLLEEHTNQEIAEKLNISMRTVEYHRLSLLQKMDAKNVIGMVKRAYESGMVDKNRGII